MSPLTGVLTETWALYRKYAAHFLLIAFVIYLVAAVLVALLSLAGLFGYFLGEIIELTAVFLLQAALVKAVQDVRDGRVDLGLSQTVQAAVPYLLPVAAAGILAAIGITIGLVLIIVPGLILLTFWCLIVPFIVIEDAGPIDAFGRSMRTVRGYAWNVFGTLVLVFLLYLAFSIVLALILVFLPACAPQLREQRRGGHPGRAVPGTGDHAHLLPADRRPRQPAVHHDRPRTGHNLGTPLPHDPRRIRGHPAVGSAPRSAGRAAPTAPRPSAPPAPGPRDATLPYSTPPEPTPPAPTEPGPATPPDPDRGAPPPATP